MDSKVAEVLLLLLLLLLLLDEVLGEARARGGKSSARLLLLPSPSCRVRERAWTVLAAVEAAEPLEAPNMRVLPRGGEVGAEVEAAEASLAVAEEEKTRDALREVRKREGSGGGGGGAGKV